jgi:hypothetical protein
MRRCPKLLALLLPTALLLTILAAHAAVVLRPRVVPAPAERLRLRLPAHLVVAPGAPFQSAWAARPPALDGVAAPEEWTDAAHMTLPHGVLRLQNDLDYLYLLLDVTEDTGNDPHRSAAPWGDYFWLVWDVNGDRNVTPDVDALHGTYPGTDTLGLSLFVEPGAVTGLSPSEAQSARGFGPSPDSPAPHRFWEVAVPLAEIGADARTWAADPLDAHPLRLGLRINSANPPISDDIPKDVLRNFNHFFRILLALSPDVTGLGGPIFATVGVIPSTEIHNGYATTEPGYTLVVKDAPFGGSLNIFGHFDGLRARGAQHYQVLARQPGTGDYVPLRLTWSNYRWEGDRFVIRQIAPDSEDRYQIPPSHEIWSLRDILVRWPTQSLPDGLWQLKIRLFDSAKNPLPEPAPAEGNQLPLMLDNTPPRVLIEEVTHGDTPVGRCEIVNLGPPPDGLRFRFTAVDYQGHLHRYALVAHYGDNDSTLITSDIYSNHITPSRRWAGVVSQLEPLPPPLWRPPEPCAYQFRLTARDRATNGYTPHIHWAEYNKHVTLLMPVTVAPPPPPPASDESPSGMAGAPAPRPLERRILRVPR